MVSRRTTGGAIETKIGNHTFRATRLTPHLKNGGQLETAAAMANHASTRTTQIYDWHVDQVSRDEIGWVRIWRATPRR
jgi:site-specific recombinase XerD